MRRGLRVVLFTCATLLQALPMAQAAEPWPSKPIRMVIPLPPGGGGDAAARLIAAEMSLRLPHPTILENRGGAGGIIGTQAVAQASPDGHTLLFTTDFHTINGALGKLPYDSVKDFAPVAQLVELQIVMLARPGLGAKTLQEVVSLARTKPKQVTFGTPGVGSPHFLAVKLLQQQSGADFLDVPYQGTGPTTAAFLGGQIDLMFAGVGAGMKFAEASKAVPIAVTGRQRDALAPKVPTVAEAGFPGYSLTSWMGILAPAGTPAPIVERLNALLGDIVADRQVANKLSALGLKVTVGTSKAFETLISGEIDARRKMIQAAGVTAER